MVQYLNLLIPIIKMDKSNFYMAPLYLELHRFKVINRQRGIDRGFNLSFAELRALTAVTILLARTEYEGHDQEIITSEEDWMHLGKTPRLSFRWNEYLDAFHGKEGKGRKGQQAERAKKALFDLSREELSLSYYRCKGEPIINVDKCKLITIINDREKTTRSGLTLIFHPIFIDNVYSFHVWKPFDLSNQICDSLKVQKPKKPVVLFIEWLLTHDQSPTYPIWRETLIRRLWLEPLYLARKHSLIERTLQECIDTARDLDFLRNYSKEVIENSKKTSEKFRFELNPELCERFNRRKNQTE